MHETNTCMSIVVNHRVCHHHLIARKLERFQIFTVLHFYHGRQIDGGLAGPTALRSRHLAPWGLISIVPFVCKIRVIALLILSSYRFFDIKILSLIGILCYKRTSLPVNYFLNLKVNVNVCLCMLFICNEIHTNLRDMLFGIIRQISFHSGSCISPTGTCFWEKTYPIE